MGLFDSVKDRILGVADQFRSDNSEQRYFDEYENVYAAEDTYEQGVYDAGPYDSAGYATMDANAQQDAYGAPEQRQGLGAGQGQGLGYQSPYATRPPQESVSVYTRSGRLVDDIQPSPSEGSFSTEESFNGELAPAHHRRSTAHNTTNQRATETRREIQSPATTGYITPGNSTPQLTAIPRPSSGKLPAYSIRPTSYDDAQLVARRVQTNQPVVISLKNTPLDTAKRMLDFCFGFTYGIGGKVQEIAPRTFVVLPAGFELSPEDIEKLKRENS